MPCDLTDYSSVETLVSQIREQFDEINLLVNNAGREMILSLPTVKPQAARDLLEVNVVAMVEMTRRCLNLLKRDSAVVNMASVVGLVGGAGLSVYSASKGAVIALTRSLAKELAPRRIDGGFSA
jgi:3-oxoacyl-[acyl-carrier protein] reductase